ncbi:transposase domain-containing protein, partial [Gemmobacter lanyuensis]|uniref:transposase domain-containing protein n=1 Tax=Gemmobacter lanyuensis TaxID=1054497 RepID=UPI001E45DAB5
WHQQEEFCAADGQGGHAPPDHRLQRQTGEFSSSAFGEITSSTHMQTCRMNNVDPTAWLTQTLERIANQWPSAEIDALMPWNYRT